MSKCCKCGAATILYDNGVAICVACADKEDLKRKLQEQEQLPKNREAKKTPFYPR